MKKVIIASISVLSLSWTGCEKILDSGDLPQATPISTPTVAPGPTEITGGVYLNEPYLNAGRKIPLANLTVVIKHLKDSLNGNILNTQTSDANGLFKFIGLNPDSTYLLYILSENSNTTYIKLPPSDTVLKKPDGIFQNILIDVNEDNVNGIFLMTTDSLGGNIPGANVLFYTSRVLAMHDSTFSGDGTLLQLQTDSVGRMLVLQLPVVDSLFIKAAFSLNGSILLYSDILSLRVNNKGIVNTTIQLR